MKPTLTLVIGLPGVGKSTVAKILAEQNGAVVINSDVIRREMFPGERSYSPEETWQVIKEQRRRVQELLQRGKSVILDALLTKRRAREESRKLANRLSVGLRIICVNADENVVESRMEERKKKGDVSEADFSYYLDRKKHFEPETGGCIVVDNSGTLKDLKTQLREVATGAGN